MALLLLHLMLAAALFFVVNWIGEHAVDFGYSSTTLFDEPEEFIALNFFLRAFSPAVFIVAISTVFVAIDRDDLRLEIFWVPIFYFVIRAVVIFALNRQRLVSWIKYLAHALVGITAANLAYEHLILPNKSLMPNLDSAGNELWLAILAFVYAVANKVQMNGSGTLRRRNKFVGKQFHSVKIRFGQVISDATNNRELQLIAYAVLIYEDYCRPQTVRFFERMMWWKCKKTTGIMQVSSTRSLSDMESVRLGMKVLTNAWEIHDIPENELYERVRKTILAYNRDDDYLWKITDVMELIAKRADRSYEDAYLKIFG